MACREFEDLILEYCEGAASPAARAAVDTHVAACPACREFLAEQQDLELRFSCSAVPASLSPAFSRRLVAKIADQRSSSRLRRFSGVLDAVGGLSVTFGAACLLQQLRHATVWISVVALAGTVGFSLWASAKALRSNLGHR